MTTGTPPALSARLITIVETSSWSVEPLGTRYRYDQDLSWLADETAL